MPGLPPQKKAAIERLLRKRQKLKNPRRWLDKRIAKAVGVSQPIVSEIRRALDIPPIKRYGARSDYDVGRELASLIEKYSRMGPEAIRELHSKTLDELAKVQDRFLVSKFMHGEDTPAEDTRQLSKIGELKLRREALEHHLSKE